MKCRVDSERRGAARVLATAFALALLTGAAQAQVTPQQLGAIKSNCRSDYMSHCMSVRPGGKEALQCLQQHVASLSPACQSAVSATMPKPAAAAPPPPPPPPVAAPPAKMAPPHKAVSRPAKVKHAKAKATPERAAPPPAPVAIAPPPPARPDAAVLMAKASQMPLRERLAIFRACDQDQAAVCPSVRRGGGRIIVCLAMHPDALSDFCRGTLAKALR